MVHALARIAGQVGADASAALRAAGLDDVDTSAAPNAELHVPIVRYFDAWREAMSAIDDPAFPLQDAAASQPEDQEVFGFLAISCAMLGEAFLRTNGYRVLYTVGASWQLHVDADATRLTWDPWARASPR